MNYDAIICINADKFIRYMILYTAIPVTQLDAKIFYFQIMFPLSFDSCTT